MNEKEKSFLIEAEYQSEEHCLMDGYSPVEGYEGLFEKDGSYAKVVGY